MTHENEQASLHRVAIRLSGFTGPAIRRLVVDRYHPASWDDGKFQEATVDAEIQGYLTEFGILRGQIHVAIKGISDEAANWYPLSQGTNSVYALLSHMIGADRLWVHQVINGETVQLDREADFASSGSLSEVLDRWEERGWTPN